MAKDKDPLSSGQRARTNWLPLLDKLRTWFFEELPYKADTIGLHLLYEDLHVAWPLRPVRPTLAPGFTARRNDAGYFR